MVVVEIDATENIVLARRLVFHRQIELAHTLAEIILSRFAIDAFAIGIAAPGDINLAQVSRLFPLPAEEEIGHAGAIRTRLVGIDAEGGASLGFFRGQAGLDQFLAFDGDVVRQRIDFRRLLERSDHARRAVDGLHQIGESVAEETRCAHGYVDARVFARFQRDDFNAVDAAAMPVPDRTHAHHVENLRHVVAARAHCRHPPEHHTDLTRNFAFILHVALDERIGLAHAHFPSLWGGNLEWIDGKEVAPGRQNVDAPARRAAGTARWHETAIQAVQRVFDFIGDLLQLRADAIAHEIQHIGNPLRAVETRLRFMADGFVRPSRLVERIVDGAHIDENLAEHLALGLAERRHQLAGMVAQIFAIKAARGGDRIPERGDVAVGQACQMNHRLVEAFWRRHLPKGMQAVVD